MPRQIALVLTLLLIGYLLRRDAREQPRVSLAVWIPITWLMINGSRQVSQWFESGSGVSAQRLAEGNPIDQVAYSALILAGIWVLARRRVRVGEIVRNNLFIILFFLYAGFSVVWSDFPLVSLKRWIKSIGDPVMVLVLWSEPFPARAITATIKRCAYILVPLSVLFCKYYPNLGRSFDVWGNAFNTGVTLDKNMLGYLLFTYGLFFVAALISRVDPSRDGHNRVRSDQIINIMFVAMIGWLHSITDSKTALVALIIGTAVIFSLRFSTVRRHFWFYALSAVLLALVYDALFSVKGAIFEASGRDASFTGRTGIWETLLQEPINPMLGVGYGSFWLGERLTRLWAIFYPTPIIQAHNGYLEVYLNLGLIGVCLIGGVLWAGLRRMRRRVTASFSASMSDMQNERILGIFGIAYGVAYLFYNVTEATFQGLNPLFLYFIILSFEYRHTRQPANAARGSLVLQYATNSANDIKQKNREL